MWEEQPANVIHSHFPRDEKPTRGCLITDKVDEAFTVLLQRD